jgi:hypothetical protein
MESCCPRKLHARLGPRGSGVEREPVERGGFGDLL